MRALITVALLVLVGCAATHSRHLAPFDPTVQKSSCPSGGFPVYVVDGFYRRFSGCTDSPALGFSIHR